MTILDTALDPFAASYVENRKAMLACLDELAAALDKAREGGGERYVTRHHARGKLLPRERIELLVDQDSPFLELSAVAAWGTDFPVGASVVTGLGVVSGVECVIVANDPTVRGGAINSYTVRKICRAVHIATANRLPLVNLVESGDGDLAGPTPASPDGQQLRIVNALARLRSAGVASVCVVFGDATGDSAYLPGLADYTIMVRNRAKVFLAGPPLVRMITGEVADDESLGGAAMHASRSGLADFLAEDERDALRLARHCVRRLGWTKLGPPPRTTRPAPPRHDPEDLLAVLPADPWLAYDPRELLTRVLDGSEFDEFKAAYGPAVVTGWGEIHGYPVGVLAHTGAALGPAEAQKATQFVQLAETGRGPLVVLQHVTGCTVGTAPEQGGIVRHGALMLAALGATAVPVITVTVGAWPAGGGFRADGPRLDFSWPNARPAARPGPAAGPAGPPTALARSGQIRDDGVIDPRDTRTVLGLCLSAAHTADLTARTAAPPAPARPDQTHRQWTPDNGGR